MVFMKISSIHIPCSRTYEKQTKQVSSQIDDKYGP